MSQPHVICILHAGPTLKMPRGDGRYFTFEQHPYCGPVRCHAVTGDPTKFDFDEDSVFWPLYYRWDLGGAQVDAHGRCVLPPLTVELRRAVEHALEFGAVAARALLDTLLKSRAP